MRTGKAGKTGGNNPGTEIIGAIVVGISIIVGAFSYAQWLAWEAVQGEAGAAIAGAFFASEFLIFVLVIAFLYTYLMRRLENRQTNTMFAANAIENAQSREQQHQEAMEMAQLSRAQGLAQKAHSDAQLSATRIESQQMSELRKELKRLQDLVGTAVPADDGWGDVDFSAFDDLSNGGNEVIIDQRG